MHIKTASIFGLLIAATLIAAGCGGGGGSEPTPTATLPPTPTPTPPSAEPTQPTGGNGGGGGEVLSVLLGEDPYVFDPDTLNLDVGKTYTLDFSVPSELHTFTLPDFGIDIFINAGEKVTEDITLDRTGEFFLNCVPHETLGMTGTVTVS